MLSAYFAALAHEEDIVAGKELFPRNQTLISGGKLERKVGPETGDPFVFGRLQEGISGYCFLSCP